MIILQDVDRPIVQCPAGFNTCLSLVLWVANQWADLHGSQEIRREASRCSRHKVLQGTPLHPHEQTGICSQSGIS